MKSRRISAICIQGVLFVMIVMLLGKIAPEAPRPLIAAIIILVQMYALTTLLWI